jgi:hypothetical protein
MEVFEEEKNLDNHREIFNEIEKSRVALTSAKDVELVNSNTEQALVSAREKSTPEKVSHIFENLLIIEKLVKQSVAS